MLSVWSTATSLCEQAYRQPCVPLQSASIWLHLCGINTSWTQPVWHQTVWHASVAICVVNVKTAVWTSVHATLCAAAERVCVVTSVWNRNFVDTACEASDGVATPQWRISV